MSITPGILDRTKRFEGNIPYMYLDSEGNVTVGVGHLLAAASYAVTLPFLHSSDASVATAQETSDEWTTIDALPFPHVASWYRPFATLSISQSYIDMIAIQDLQQVEAELIGRFPAFSTFPTPAQAGLVDMAFNLGTPKLICTFPNFVAAVRRQDWQIAAQECNRTGIPDDRNSEVALLFQSAATSSDGQRDLQPAANQGPKGISIHIGLNQVDPSHYGTSGTLRGCENDAHSMLQIAQSLGYDSKLLLTSQATAINVLRELSIAAEALKEGDILFLTYAGHGSQVPDVNGDETGNPPMDETWCLYDRMLIDDELYRMWSQFKSGVRVAMVSDSCHSGTMARELISNQAHLLPILQRGGSLAVRAGLFQVSDDVVPRTLPEEIAAATYEHHKGQYDELQWAGIRTERNLDTVTATVILLAACQDTQTAGDGVNHGLFTMALLEAWSNSDKRGGYFSFFKEIQDVMKKEASLQTPNYFTVGAANTKFEQSPPFAVNSTGLPSPSANPLPLPSNPPVDQPNLSLDERLARLKASSQEPQSPAPIGGNADSALTIDQRLAALKANATKAESVSNPSTKRAQSPEASQYRVPVN